MREGENSKRVESKIDNNRLSAELLSKADRILDLVEKDVPEEQMNNIRDAFEDLEFAVEHTNLNIPEEVENANSLIADFRSSLPDKYQSEIFDLPLPLGFGVDNSEKDSLSPKEQKRLSEFERELEKNLSPIEEGIRTIMQRAEKDSKITKPQFSELTDLERDIKVLTEEYRRQLKEEYFLDDELFEEIKKTFIEFQDTAESYFTPEQKVPSEPPVDTEKDSWLDVSDMAGVEKDTSGEVKIQDGDLKGKVADVKKGIEKLGDQLDIEDKKIEAKQRLDKIKYEMITKPGQEEQIERDCKNFVASLDVYLERVRNGEAVKADRKAIDKLIKDFFNNLKKEEKKMKAFSEVKEKDVLGQAQIWVKQNKRLAQEKMSELRAVKKIADDEDYALKILITRLFASFDEFLKNVEKNCKDDKQKADNYKKEPAGKLSNYLVSMSRKMETLKDKEKKQEDLGHADTVVSDLGSADTMLDISTPVPAPRTTLGYDKPHSNGDLPRGVSNGNGHSSGDADATSKDTRKNKRVVKDDESGDAGELSSTELPEGVRLGLAIWKNKDFDQLIYVTGYAGEHEGKHFVTIEGSMVGVPVDEIDFSETPVGKTDKKELVETPAEKKEPVKRSPEEQEFLDKIDLAVGQVRQMQGMLKTIQTSYEKDIPHADLLPDYKNLFKEKVKVITGFIGALERFQEFFKDRKKARPTAQEVLKMVDEIESKFNEVTALKEEVQDLKREAAQIYEKKLEYLNKHHDEASGLIDRVDVIMLEPLGLEKETFYDYFPKDFLNRSKDYSQRLTQVRDRALEVESLSQKLLDILKEKKDYPRLEEENLSANLIPKMKEEIQKLEEESKKWSSELGTARTMAESAYIENITRLRVVIYERLLPDNNVIGYFYKNISPDNWEFVWPDEKEREQVLAKYKTPEELAQVAQEKFSKENEYIEDILKYIKDSLDMNFDAHADLDRSPEKISELFQGVGKILNVQVDRIEMMPKIFTEAIDEKYSNLVARRVEVKKQLEKFYLSEKFELAVAELLGDFDNIISSLEERKKSFEKAGVRDLRNNLNNEKIRELNVETNEVSKGLEQRFVKLLAELKEAERILREEKIKKDLEAVEKKKKKKKKKTKEEEMSESPAFVAEAEAEEPKRSALVDHLSLKEEKDTKKDIEKILEIEGVVDITPLEILKSFSQKDFEDLRELLDNKDRKGFKEFLSGKIVEIVKTNTSPEQQVDLQEAVSSEVYDILKEIIDKRIEAEKIKKSGKFLKYAKKAGKVGSAFFSMGVSLGIFYAVDSQIGAGSLGLAVGAGATVAIKEVYREISERIKKTAVGEAWSGRLKKINIFSSDKKKNKDLVEEQRFWEDAVDEYVTKENIAVLLSNALRERTTEEWVKEKDLLSKSLSISGGEQIPEEKYKKCLESLREVGLEQFFKNALNHVNSSPDYRALPQEEKILIAQTIALTVGQSYRNNLEVSREFSDIKAEASVRGKSSWIAEKYFKLMSIRSGEFLKKHNDEDKGWGRVAGHAWSVLVGGSLMRVLRSSSLEARVLGGAVAGAGVGLTLEQHNRRNAEEKRLQEVDNMLQTTEKKLLKYESLPIDQLSYSKVKKLSEVSADLQAKIDMGVVRDKATKSRIDGLVYRVRKIESEKAMELENSIEAFDQLTRTLKDNNEKISKSAKKQLDRLRSATKNKQPAFMLGGAILGAGLSLGLFADLKELLGGSDETLDSSVKEIKHPESYSGGGTPEAYNLPAEAVPDNNGNIPSLEDSSEGYAPPDPSGSRINPLMPSESIPEPVAPIETLQTSPPPVEAPSFEDAVNQNVLGKISDQYPNFKDDFSWLSEKIKDKTLSPELAKSLKDAWQDLTDEYKLTGKVDVTEKYFDVLKSSVKE